MITNFNISIENDSEFPINLRELHSGLQSRKDFSEWAKKRLAPFAANSDFFIIGTPTKHEKQGGHNRIDYAITLDTAKHIAMMENTERGRQVRQYFIACEKALQATTQQTIGVGIHSTPAEMLRDKMLAFQISTRKDADTYQAMQEVLDRIEGPQPMSAAAHAALKDLAYARPRLGEDLPEPRRGLLRWVAKVAGDIVDAGYHQRQLTMPDLIALGPPVTAAKDRAKALGRALPALLGHVYQDGDLSFQLSRYRDQAKRYYVIEALRGQ